MRSPQKREIRRAVQQAQNMLERNADACETFEGVLSKEYVRALRVFVVLGEKFLAKGNPHQPGL